MTEIQEKKIRVHILLDEIGHKDMLLRKFFDTDSEESLDLKIKVLTQIKNGVHRNDIPEYYSILELYPGDDQLWDLL